MRLAYSLPITGQTFFSHELLMCAEIARSFLYYKNRHMSLSGQKQLHNKKPYICRVGSCVNLNACA